MFFFADGIKEQVKLLGGPFIYPSNEETNLLCEVPINRRVDLKGSMFYKFLWFRVLYVTQYKGTFRNSIIKLNVPKTLRTS